MDKMFSDHEFGIFLEDDVLLSPSFLKFAEEIFYKYRDNYRVGHINASNFYPSYPNITKDSYYFSEYAHIWGFGTWRRMWKKYDLKMLAWRNVDKRDILRDHCFSYRERRSLMNMFNLHCNNDKPLACDYQWTFNLLYNNALSITPYQNMSLNIGFERNDSTHTKTENPFLRPIENCLFPLTHPKKIKRNLYMDKKVSSFLSPSYTEIYKKKIKKLFPWKKHL